MRELVVPPQTAHIVPSGTFILQPGTHGGTTWVATNPYSMSPFRQRFTARKSRKVFFVVTYEIDLGNSPLTLVVICFRRKGMRKGDK